MENSDFLLYSFFRSTSTARIRIAAHLKGIELSYKYVNLRAAEQFTEEFGKLNPNRTVPILIINPHSSLKSSHQLAIRQSVAILEFFEEAFPEKRPLLPALYDISGRARVRELVNLITCDVQPSTNQRILKRVKQDSGSEVQMHRWAKTIMWDGLRAFEQLIQTSAGKFCYGDQITMADVVLAPAVENATRYGVDIDALPTVKRVFDTLSRLDEFKAGNWINQGDTPVTERGN
jgi:maleylacetoacetate isomerase